MRTQNPNDVFYVTMSKWKVWAFVILCWAIACISLFPILLFTAGILTDRQDFISDVLPFVFICILLFLFFAVSGAMFLKKLNAPIATLTQTEFSGIRNFKRRKFEWTSSTVIYRGNKNLILANLDANQSRASKLWGGPKAAIIVHNAFAKQSRQDVMDAINHLSPYPVTETTIWGAAKE